MATKAIVIGAGPAGASAAFRLKEAGCDVRLIEREATVGGRTRTIRRNGFIMDIGAGLMPSTYTSVLRLLKDAHADDMLEPMRSPTAIWRDGELHYIEATNMMGSMLKTRLLSLRSKLGMLPAAIDMWKMWKHLDFENLGRAAPFDREDESLADYTRRVMNQEALDYLVNPMQKLMYVMSAEKASLVDLFWSAKNLFADDAYCVRGGMGRIVDRATEKLDVSVDTEVLAVTEAGNRVDVVMRDANGKRTESADICVIAVPGNKVSAIDRGLSQGARDYLSNLHYSMLTDVHVNLKTRPAERAVLIMVPDSADKDVCGILVDHNKGRDRAPPDKGALSIFLDDAWVRAHWHLADEEITRLALEKAERVMPGISTQVESVHVQRWEFAATVSHPGSWRKLAHFVDGLDMKRRVQLAGDYFTLASVNGAVTSGELAAKRLIDNYVR